MSSTIYPSSYYCSYLLDRGIANKVKIQLSATGSIALVGPSKVGKTVTAINYYTDQRPYWSEDGPWYQCPPFYLDATTNETLVKSYKASSASVLDIDPNSTPLESLIQKINEYAAENFSLFIFDNVTDETHIEKFLPPPPSHLIITSRMSITINKIANLELQPFTREDSVDYFKQNLRRHWNTSTGEFLHDANQLAEILEDYPPYLEKAVREMLLTLDPIATKLKTIKYDMRDYRR